MQQREMRTAQSNGRRNFSAKLSKVIARVCRILTVNFNEEFSQMNRMLNTDIDFFSAALAQATVATWDMMLGADITEHSRTGF